MNDFIKSLKVGLGFWVKKKGGDIDSLANAAGKAKGLLEDFDGKLSGLYISKLFDSEKLIFFSFQSKILVTLPII